MILVLFLTASYLLGSFPTAFVLGRLFKKIDIREHGSGNSGARNSLRVLGKGYAIVVLLIDFFKGFFLVLAAAVFFQNLPAEQRAMIQLTAGFMAVLGHIFPLYLKFRGGKGVATTAGMLSAFFPLFFPLCLAIMIIGIILTQYVALASLITAFSVPLLYAILGPLPQARSVLVLVTLLLIPVIIAFSHRKNLVKILKNEEKKVYLCRRKPKGRE